MRPSRLAATTAFVTLAAADTYLAGRSSARARRVRRLTKPLLMPTLGAASIPDRPVRHQTLTRGVQVAQGFSWLGDVALLSASRAGFLSGVTAFAGAHAGYIAAFARTRDPNAGASHPGPRAAAVAFATTAPAMAISAGRKDPTLRVPIAAYAGILASMFGTSTMLNQRLPGSARGRIVAGTTLFLASDSLLGIQKFMLSRPVPPLESAVMATYTAGQWLIADGARRAVEGVHPS
jgi:uncharacterized membrane protein YhhN